jgi:hypothetical protein
MTWQAYNVSIVDWISWLVDIAMVNVVLFASDGGFVVDIFYSVLVVYILFTTETGVF